jgi:hypothetical protein
MASRAERQWSEPIANEDLTAELLPAPGAPWDELVFFAGTLNGYDILGDTEALQAFAEPIYERYRDTGELPDDLTELRLALFAEQRRDHFTDSASSPEVLAYIHALVEAIRAAVTGESADAPQTAASGNGASAAPAGPVDLKLGTRTIHTVFDLLGHKEDDITYSVGWGLAQSHTLAYALLAEVFDGELGTLSALQLQKADRETGRTDIEIETDRVHLIVEAKRGWTVPGIEQLTKYARRLQDVDERRAHIAVVAEAAPHFPPVTALPPTVEGVPVSYIPWSRVAELVSSTAAITRRHAEKRLLQELHRYLRRLMTSQDVTSNLVYVVSLNHDDLSWSDITFVQIVMERDRYFHPVGGPGKQWPKTPANYLGFRFDGQLQRISFVEHYEVITRPHDHIPDISPDADWTDEPHFLYHLGPPLPLPDRPVKTTGMYNRRTRVALDLLLTCATLRDAELKTKERLAQAGEEG